MWTFGLSEVGLHFYFRAHKKGVVDYTHALMFCCSHLRRSDWSHGGFHCQIAGSGCRKQCWRWEKRIPPLTGRALLDYILIYCIVPYGLCCVYVFHVQAYIYRLLMYSICVIQYISFLSTWYQSTGSESPIDFFFSSGLFPSIFRRRRCFRRISSLCLPRFSVFQSLFRPGLYTNRNLGRPPCQSRKEQPDRSIHAPPSAA